MIITSSAPTHIEMETAFPSRKENKQTNEKNKQKEIKTMTATTQT